MGKYAVKMGDRGGFFEKRVCILAWETAGTVVLKENSPDKTRKQLEPFGKDSSCLLFFDEDAPMGCCFFFIRIRILRSSQF
ncbi:hypothetical protein [Anaerotignum lactatifermentans]|uniref:hypothetical protein n=1 Tax=Anaerotignum lactatifermentans TaxID=160404 RepID=UPI0039F510AD